MNYIKNIIKSDINRIKQADGLSKIELAKLYIKYPALGYLRIYRKAHYFTKNKSLLGYYYRWKLFKSSLKLGYQINVNTTIGQGLYLGHRGTVVINGNAVLGDNINIANGVTIGQENRGKRKGAPKIGNRVWIGANAVIVGKITIGNNVLIAPNAYVNFDVPDDCIVIGNPAKIIMSKSATEGYI